MAELLPDAFDGDDLDDFEGTGDERFL
jgi:hypothetical protein